MFPITISDENLMASELSNHIDQRDKHCRKYQARRTIAYSMESRDYCSLFYAAEIRSYDDTITVTAPIPGLVQALGHVVVTMAIYRR